MKISLHSDDQEQGQEEGDIGEEDLKSKQGRRKLVGIVDRAISSEFFWSYCRLSHYIVSVFEDLSVFAETCSCHGHERSGKTWSSYRSALSAYYYVAPQRGCSQAGLRAPEFAAGAARQVTDKLNEQHTGVVKGFATRLSAADTSVLLEDWQAACSLAKRLVVTKLGAWEQLPLLMAGLGHHVPATAKLVAQRCLQLSETSDHPLSDLVLGRDSPIRPQVERFASGAATMQELPLLKLVADRLAFMPVTERSIEGRHRITKALMLSAPNLRASTLSLRLRERETTQGLEAGEMNIDSLGDWTRLAYNPTKLMDLLDLHCRPGLLIHATSAKILGDAIYRVDLDTQYGSKAAVQSQQHHQRHKMPVQEAP